MGKTVLFGWFIINRSLIILFSWCAPHSCVPFRHFSPEWNEFLCFLLCFTDEHTATAAAPAMRSEMERRSVKSSTMINVRVRAYSYTSHHHHHPSNGENKLLIFIMLRAIVQIYRCDKLPIGCFHFACWNERKMITHSTRGAQESWSWRAAAATVSNGLKFEQ